jgi:hypothetical protein
MPQGPADLGPSQSFKYELAIRLTLVEIALKRQSVFKPFSAALVLVIGYPCNLDLH